MAIACYICLLLIASVLRRCKAKECYTKQSQLTCFTDDETDHAENTSNNKDPVEPEVHKAPEEPAPVANGIDSSVTSHASTGKYLIGVNVYLCHRHLQQLFTIT